MPRMAAHPDSALLDRWAADVVAAYAGPAGEAAGAGETEAPK